MNRLPHRRRRRNNESNPPGDSAAVLDALAALIVSIRPHALCDSCIALDLHVSHAEAREAALGTAMGDAFERALRRCHRCGRTVEATAAR